MKEGTKGRIENAFRNAGREAGIDDAGDVVATRRVVPEGTWDDIVTLQEKKRKLVDGLRTWRKKQWDAHGANAEERAEAEELFEAFEKGDGARTLVMQEDGTYAAILKGGERIVLTKGEVMAAAEWGVWWKFGENVPSAMQRETMTNQVRYAVAGKFDDQLIAFGKESRWNDDRMKDTYARVAEKGESLEKLPNGNLAEKMLLSLLTKAMYDSDLPFTVERADIYEDIELKIDFVVTVKDKARRFVKVGEPEQRIGIQFTLDPTATERKREQIRRVMRLPEHGGVDDLVLVTIPLSDIRKNFDEWRYDEKGNRKNANRLDPRGPDHLWDKETKQQIYDALVRGIGLHAPAVQKAA